MKKDIQSSLFSNFNCHELFSFVVDKIHKHVIDIEGFKIHCEAPEWLFHTVDMFIEMHRLQVRASACGQVLV